MTNERDELRKLHRENEAELAAMLAWWETAKAAAPARARAAFEEHLTSMREEIDNLLRLLSRFPPEADEITKQFELSNKGRLLFSALQSDPSTFSDASAADLREELEKPLFAISDYLFDPAYGEAAKIAQLRTADVVKELEARHFKRLAA